jgi:Tol biopolymer transport system component
MLRGSLLAAALFALLGLGSGTGHVRNGRIAYEHVGNGNRFQIYTVTATGAHRRHLTSGHTYSSWDAAYSPNGKRIAFVRASKHAIELWTMNADGTHQRRLTQTAGIEEIDPAWSPDGTQIALAIESPVGQQGIWVMTANGQNRKQLTTGADRNPAWSPDGSQIAFQRSDFFTHMDSVRAVPASGGTPTDLTQDPLSDYLDPAWSPNGNWLLLSSDRGADQSQLDLWDLNLRAAGPVPSFVRVTTTPGRDERNPAWSPDGRKLVYSGEGSFHGASSSQLYVSNANGTNRHILTHACGECAWINDDPSWQPLEPH